MQWVFLHGFLGTGDDWAQVCAALGWGLERCFCPDLPGHGGEPLWEPVSYEGWTRWLAAKLDERGWQQVALVGYSLGGRLALAFAARWPQRVARLVLVSAHPGLEDRAARAQRARQDDRRAARIRRQGLPAFLEAWYRLPLFDLETRPALRQALIARRSRQQAEAMARVIAAMSPGRQPPLWDALAQLPLPVGYVAGERDAKYTAVAARVARWPHVTAYIIPQATHMVHLDAPEALAAILWGGKGA